jgi:hypothetical protein
MDVWSGHSGAADYDNNAPNPMSAQRFVLSGLAMR